jgi:hypothetical protein
MSSTDNTTDWIDLVQTILFLLCWLLSIPVEDGIFYSILYKIQFKSSLFTVYRCRDLGRGYQYKLCLLKNFYTSSLKCFQGLFDLVFKGLFDLILCEMCKSQREKPQLVEYSHWLWSLFILSLSVLQNYLRNECFKLLVCGISVSCLSSTDNTTNLLLE